MLWLLRKLESLLFWRQPYLTVACGLVLSLAICYPKSAILLCSVTLYLGQKDLFNYLSGLSRYGQNH